MKRIDDRSQFATDEAFANFRGLIIDNKRSSYLFRSASVHTNRYGRAETVQMLMYKHHIDTVIDLSRINHACRSEEFGFALSYALSEAIDQNGPYIIQCDAGKKRTGFACVLLEALSGTSRENIISDYLESYINNNGLSPTESDTIMRLRSKVTSLIEFIASYSESPDLVISASSYLSKHDMTKPEIIKIGRAHV